MVPLISRSHSESLEAFGCTARVPMAACPRWSGGEPCDASAHLAAAVRSVDALRPVAKNKGAALALKLALAPTLKRRPSRWCLVRPSGQVRTITLRIGIAPESSSGTDPPPQIAADLSDFHCGFGFAPRFPGKKREIGP